MSQLGAAGWTMLVLFLYVLALTIAESISAGAVTDVVSRTAAGAAAYGLTVFFILRVHEPESDVGDVLAFRAPRPVHALFALVAGAGLAAPSAWLDARMLRLFPAPADELALALTEVAGPPSFSLRIAGAVAAVLVMPALDEAFFRGALFTPLRKHGKAAAVVFATAAYETLVSTPHPREMVAFFLVVSAFAAVRASTGTVVTAMLARVAFHAPAHLPELFGWPRLERAVAAPAAVLGSLAVAACALALLFITRRPEPGATSS